MSLYLSPLYVHWFVTIISPHHSALWVHWSVTMTPLGALISDYHLHGCIDLWLSLRFRHWSVHISNLRAMICDYQLLLYINIWSQSYVCTELSKCLYCSVNCSSCPCHCQFSHFSLSLYTAPLPYPPSLQLQILHAYNSVNTLFLHTQLYFHAICDPALIRMQSMIHRSQSRIFPTGWSLWVLRSDFWLPLFLAVTLLTPVYVATSWSVNPFFPWPLLHAHGCAAFLLVCKMFMKNSIENCNISHM